MNNRWILALTFASALGCGLNAGVFFGFSSFVMKALARLSPSQGMAAMNSINVVAVTPVFMAVLFGTGAACLLLAVLTPFTWDTPGGASVFLGAVFYLVGAILVTMVFNVAMMRSRAWIRRPPTPVVYGPNSSGRGRCGTMYALSRRLPPQHSSRSPSVDRTAERWRHEKLLGRETKPA